MADDAVCDVFAVLLDRPLVDEAVGKVIRCIAELGLDCLRLALRVLVREGRAIAVRLEAVQVHLEERRFPVVDRYVEEVCRRVALDAVRWVEALACAEHDAERVCRALAGAVEDEERARLRGSDRGDLDALAPRGGHSVVCDDRLRTGTAECAGGRTLVVVEERVDGAARRVA